MKLQIYIFLLSALICFVSSSDICNKYCDNIAASELPNSTAFNSFEMYGRKLTVHGQRDGEMIFARLSSGQEGDKIWLERFIYLRGKWNNQKIGAVAVGEDMSAITTAGFNVDGNLMQESRAEIGTIRVCAKANDHHDQKCSPWLRVPICNTVCDQVESSLFTDKAILHTLNVNGRQLELIASRYEEVIYGHLSHAQSNDELWLERSFSDGQEWRAGSLLGFQSVPADSNEAYTPAFNVNYKIGVPILGTIRACVKTKSIVCTQWSRPPICKRLCDGADHRDVEEVEIVATKERYGRTVKLFASVDETEGLAFGRTSGEYNDREVWLERSWDNGESWETFLGHMQLKDNEKDGYSKAYNYNRETPVMQAGQIRACTKTWNVNNILCTKWTSLVKRNGSSTTSTALTTSMATTTTTTTEEPNSEVVEESTEEGRIVTFEDCALSIIDHMKQTQDRLYYRFARISQDEAVTRFKKIFCKNYSWQKGNCNRCFREVFM